MRCFSEKKVLLAPEVTRGCAGIVVRRPTFSTKNNLTFVLLLFSPLIMNVALSNFLQVGSNKLQAKSLRSSQKESNLRVIE